jgi:hypothetical protein
MTLTGKASYTYPSSVISIIYIDLDLQTNTPVVQYELVGSQTFTLENESVLTAGQSITLVTDDNALYSMPTAGSANFPIWDILTLNVTNGQDSGIFNVIRPTMDPVVTVTYTSGELYININVVSITGVAIPSSDVTVLYQLKSGQQVTTPTGVINQGFLTLINIAGTNRYFREGGMGNDSGYTYNFTVSDIDILKIQVTGTYPIEDNYIVNRQGLGFHAVYIPGTSYIEVPSDYNGIIPIEQVGCRVTDSQTVTLNDETVYGVNSILPMIVGDSPTHWKLDDTFTYNFTVSDISTLVLNDESENDEIHGVPVVINPFYGTRNVLDSFIVLPTSYSDATYTNVGIQGVSYRLVGDQTVTTGTGSVITTPTSISLQSTGISGRWRIISAWTANFSAYDIDRVNVNLSGPPSILENVPIVDGPSGGGGNTGDTGGSSGGNSNNMSTGSTAVHLALNYVYGDTATQDVQITVYGESAEALSPDHTVVVNVPLADLKGLVTFSVGNTGTAIVDEEGEIRQYPNIALDPSAVLIAREAGLRAALTSKPRVGTFGDDAPANVPTLSAELYALGYTGSILDTSIPVEAIKEQQPLGVMIDNLDNIITSITVEGGETPQVGSDVKKQALASLFEVAVAQGRVTKEDESPHLDLVLGDSITLYIRYDLEQTRRYRADPSVELHSNAAGAGTVSLTFAGKTFDITFNNEDNDAKESATGSVLYAFKFVASATSSVFA